MKNKIIFDSDTYSEFEAPEEKRGREKGFVGIIRKAGPFNLVAVSFVFGILGQIQLYYRHSVSLGLLFFAAGIIFFIFADIVSKKNHKKEEMNRAVEAVFFIFIIAVAVFLRFYKIGEVPRGCFVDEAYYGEDAIRIMNGEEIEGTTLPVYIEGMTHNAAMYIYFIAAFFKMFGVGEVQIRVVTGILGVLTVPVFYFFIRSMFGPVIALCGGFLMATMRWNVSFSRFGLHAIFTALMTGLSIYFAWRAYRKRKWSDFILFGLSFALLQYTYSSARLIPFAIILLAPVIFFRDPDFFKENWKKIILSVCVFLAVFAPLGIYAVKNTYKFTSRLTQVSVLDKDLAKRWYHNEKTIPQIVAMNEKLTWLMFNNIGDGNARHNNPTAPMLDFMTGTFAFLGFGYLLWKMFNPVAFFLLSLFVVIIHGGVFTIEAPHALRLIAIIPVVAVFAMIFLNKTWIYFTEQYGLKYRPILLVYLIGVMGYIGWENYKSYFIEQGKSPGFSLAFSYEDYSRAKYLKKLGPDWQGIIMYIWTHPGFTFPLYPQKNYEFFDPSESIPIKSGLQKNFVYMLDPEYLPVAPMLQRMYPNGKLVEFRNEFNESQLLWFAFEVPYEDVKSWKGRKTVNGLKAAYYPGKEWAGKPQISRVDPFILFNWGRDPISAPYSVKWQGKIKIEKTGNYSFLTRSNDYSDVYIDGEKVVENPGGRGTAMFNDSQGSVSLTRGLHEVVVRYYETLNYSKIHFLWQPPGTIKPEVVPMDVLFPN